MRPSRALWPGLLSIALFSACKSSATQPSKAPEVAIADDDGGEPVQVEDRVATAFDLIDDDASIVALLDANVLRQGELFKTLALLTTGVPGARQTVDELEAKCGFDPIRAVTRAALSTGIERGGPDEKSVLIAFETTEPADAVFKCVGNLLPEASSLKIERVEVRGYPALLIDGEAYLVARDNVFVTGKKASVERALGRRSTGPRLPDEVYLAVIGTFDNPFNVERAELQLGEGVARLHLSLSATTDSPASAQKLAETVEQGRKLLEARLADSDVEDAQRDLFSLILRDVRIEQQGAQAAATLNVDGREQVSALIGAVSAVAIYGVKRYIMRAKRREALVQVTDIAMRLRHHAENDGKGRLPNSAPLTPSQAPSGDKVQTDAAAWEHPSWRAIAFSMEGPQYFAYEFVTAKDRKSAVVKAHSDIEGDGKVSTIEAKVTVKKDGSVEMTAPVDTNEAGPVMIPIGP